MSNAQCSVCKKMLDPAEMSSGRSVCDRCYIIAGREEEQKVIIAKNLDRIPPEYRNQNILARILEKTEIQYVRKQNLFISGTTHKILRVKWAIMEDIWAHGKNVLPINFISWYNEYKAGGANKWEMMTGIVDYNGYVVIDCDNLYGVDDQSLLYNIMQIRRERGRYMCILFHADNITAEKMMLNPVIRSFIADEQVNNYRTISMFRKE